MKLFVTANNMKEKCCKLLATQIIKDFNTRDEITQQDETLVITEKSVLEVFSIESRL